MSKDTDKNDWKAEQPTEKQAKMILTILSTLDFKEEVLIENKGQASEFISMWKDKAFAVMNKPTEKQLSYIKYLNKELGVHFKGGTKKDASKFIDENKKYLNKNLGK